MPRGNSPVRPMTEWKIVALLLTGMRRKEVARICGVSVSAVAKIKANYPLFFKKRPKE